jgi:hypothetical protein
MAPTSTCNGLLPYWCNEIASMYQVASSDTFLEIEHAWTDCPLGTQRLARLDGTIDDCAGGLGHVDNAACSHGPGRANNGRVQPALTGH